jgi:Ca2+-binding RTX toxin-like protein
VGTEGADTFFYSPGNDVFKGLGGSDTLRPDLGGEVDSLTLDLASGRGLTGSQFAGAGHLLRVYSIENVVGTFGADTLLGNQHANRLVGGSRTDAGDVVRGRGGDDQLSGGGGDDTLDGGTGRNSLDGGPGTDTCTRPATGPRAVACEM